MTDRSEPKKPAEPRKGLGRGLSALLGEADAAVLAGSRNPSVQPGERIASIPVDLIDPNPDQPRRRFDPAALSELAASIAEKGVLQPVILRPVPAGPDPAGPGPSATGRYQIVAGERRWRAAQQARLHAIPAMVRNLDDRAVLEIAIVENVQRADLNPVEEAEGYARLIEGFAYTQEALARTVGKSRSHLANTMRLLALPEEVLAMLRDGRLAAGQARALITAPDPVALAREAVARGLTTRQLEARARAARQGAAPARTASAARPEKDADTRLLEGDLSAAIGMRVEIRHTADGAGELRIRYRDLDDLDRICRHLAGG